MYYLLIFRYVDEVVRETNSKRYESAELAQTNDIYGYQGKLIVKIQTQGTFASVARYHTKDVSQDWKIS